MGSPPPPDETPPPDDGDTPAWSAAPAGEINEPAAERYAVRGELARGGLGRVLEADDRVLGRPVAIKELLRDSPGNRARFLREIRVTARLQHPSIVPIYDAVPGADGALRYAMKLVAGTTLADAVAATRTLDERLALVPHLLAVADAVAYAHARAVIHRDIKPQNILIGAYGETLLIDWGVAKDLGDAEDGERVEDDGEDAGLTRVGAIVGTPAYMAPEQARGEPADRRSDVYALGATLYHLLAGRPPIDGTADDTLLALRTGRRPPLVEAVAPEVPPDLASIVRRAMAEAPGDRYPSGQELRQDLHRFSTGQLVAARRYTRADLVRRWLARHRVSVGIAAVASVIAGATAIVAAVRVVAERNNARVAQADAESRSNALTLAYAGRSLESDPTEAATWLAAYPPEGADVERLFRLAQAVVARGVARVAAAPPALSCSGVAYTRDSARVAAVGETSALAELATGLPTPAYTQGQGEVGDALGDGDAVIGTLTGTIIRLGKDGAATVLATLPGTPTALATLDDTAIYLGDRAGTVSRVDVATGEVLPLLATGIRINGLVVADGAWTAASGDGSLWTGPTTGGPPRLLLRGSAPLTQLAALGDGRVVVGDEAGNVLRVGAEGATPLLHLPRPVRRLAVGDQGRLVFAADGATTSRVIRLGGATPEILSPPWGETLVLGAAAAPGDEVVAAVLDDGTLHAWRPATGDEQVRRERSRLAGPVEFAPDGTSIATCSTDAGLRVWPTPALSGSLHRGHTGRVFHPLFLPDGRVATDSDDHTVRVWPLPGGEPMVLRGHTDQVYGLEVSPDGRHLVDAANDGLAFVWDLVTGAGVALRGHEGRVRRAIFTADGQRVLTGSRDGTLRAWSLDGTSLVVTPAHPGGVHWLALDDDGRTVWSVGRDRTLRRWDPDTGALTTVASGLGPDGGPVLRVFPLHGGRALTCTDDHTVVLVAPDGSLRSYPSAAPTVCAAIELAPDQRTAAVPVGAAVMLLDLESGAWRRLEGLPDEIQGVSWSPDGRLLALAGLDGSARILRVADGAEGIAWLGEAGVLGVRFSPDGRRLAAGGLDHTLWVGPVDEAALLPRAPGALRERIAGLTLAKRSTAAP